MVLNHQTQFEDVKIKNLVPENLRGGNADTFISDLEKLDEIYQKIKEQQMLNINIIMSQ